MRVLLVNAHGADTWWGGVERGVGLAASELTARGVGVSILRASGGGEDGTVRVSSLHRRGAGRTDVRIMNRVVDLVSYPTRLLQSVVEREAPDIVHTHNLSGISTAVWEVARRLHIPVLHSLHDYYLLCPRMSLMTRGGEPCGSHPFCELRTRRLSRAAGAVSIVTGVSEALLRTHAPLFPHARLEVLRNPMAAYNDRAFSTPRRSPLTVGYLGSLSAEKGIPALLDAAARLEGEPCEFRIGGTGRLYELVAARAASSANVHYHGGIGGEDKYRFIERCDVGIIPSVWEEPGGPTHSLVEWLTARRPVIMSGRGGLAECSELGGTITIEPDAGSIEDAVRSLLDDDVWKQLVGSIGTWDRDEELSSWIDRQLELYSALETSSRLSLTP